jgi:hypothetical protein
MTAKNHGDEATNTFNAVGITGHVYWRLYYGRVNPYLFFRVGGIFTRAEASYDNVAYTRTANGAVFGAGVGIEFHPSRNVGIRFQTGGMLTTSDYLDAYRAGTMNDGYTTATLGISYYFSSRRR